MHDIRIGIIGAGKHARANIFPSLKLLQQPVACVCSQHLDRAESAAREFQAGRAYSQYTEMLEKENLDAVIVSTGIQHARIVEDCLKAGLHVFVEKPLGPEPGGSPKRSQCSPGGRKNRHGRVYETVCAGLRQAESKSSRLRIR